MRRSKACRIDGLRLPHRSTIQRRVDELDVLTAARRRGQKALENAVTPSAGNYQSDVPNEIWQIDHTVVDVIVVDEETRLPIGRRPLPLARDLRQDVLVVRTWHRIRMASGRPSINSALR